MKSFLQLILVLFSIFLMLSFSTCNEKRKKEAQTHSTKVMCRTSNDCNKFYTCQENACVHKGFFPLTIEESIFGILTLVLTGVCMSVGLGAGIFYVPLLTILGKFYIKEAVPISKFLIFVSSIFTSFYHFGQKHPKYEFRSLIDYNLAYFMLPSMLVGVYYGYYLHNIAPNSFIFALLIIVFAILNYSIINKVIKMRNEQNIRNQNPILIVKTSDDEGKPLISQMNEQVKIEDQDVVSKINTYFYIKSFFAGLTIFFFISFAIMTGLSGEPYLNYKSCSRTSIVVGGSFLLIMSILNYYILVYWRREKALIENNAKIDEIELTGYNLFVLVCLGFFTGMACICLGVGAGTVTNPILLGFLDYYAPSVISATSVYLMWIVALFANYVYYMTNQLNLEYAFIMSNFAMLGCIVGLTSMTKILKRAKDESIIVYLVLILVLISTVLLVTSGTIDFINILNKEPDKIFQFGTLCPNSVADEFLKRKFRINNIFLN